MTVVRPLVLLVLVLSLSAFLPSLAFGQAADSDSVADAAVFLKLKRAVAANDRPAVASLFVYPFRVNRTPRRHSWVETRAALLRRYDAILTSGVRRAILAQSADSLFYSWRGLMVGNGTVWIDGRCEDAQLQKCSFGIVAINLSQPR
jgi:hypothetical protein